MAGQEFPQRCEGCPLYTKAGEKCVSLMTKLALEWLDDTNFMSFAFGCIVSDERVFVAKEKAVVIEDVYNNPFPIITKFIFIGNGEK